MRIVVVGNGSIGQRHAANARLLGQDVITVDPEGRHADVRSVDEVVDADAVIVATPSAFHISTAQWAIEAGAPVFVEKPCGRSSAEAALLLDAKVPVQVGFNMRFDASLLAFRDRLPEVGRVRWARVEFGQHVSTWRPGRDYRETPAVDGILLEASHEIDIVSWLFGPTSQVVGASLDRRLDVREDSASALLRMDDGATVELHLDMLRHGYSRSITVCGERDTLTWTPDWVGLGGVVDKSVNGMYVRELASFIEVARNGSRPDVGVAEAVAAHVLIEKIREADEIGKISEASSPVWSAA